MLETPRDLLIRTFRLYRAQFWLFIGYAAWLLPPLAAFLILTSLPENPLTNTLAILAIFVQIFVSIWMAICIMKSVVLLEQKQVVDPNRLSVESLRRIHPVLIVAFLQILIIFGGLILFIVPAILFWVWYAHSQISTAVDNKRPLDALTYSRALVKGRFFPVLWRLIAGPIVIGLGYTFVLGFILLIIGTILGFDPVVILSDEPPLWTQLIESMGDIFVIPLLIIYSILLYTDLKKTLHTSHLEKDATVT